MNKINTRYPFVVTAITLLLLSSCAHMKKPDMKKEQAKTYHSMGNFTSKQSDYQRAADLYQKAYKLDPSKVKSLLALAKVQLLMDKQDEAITTYNKVLHQDKNNKEARQGLAASYFTSGESMEAAQHWIALLTQEPKNVDALNGLGLVMEQIHQYKEAQSCFNFALKSVPEHPILLNNLGLTLAIQGSIDEGIKQLRIAQKTKPSERLKNNIALLQSIANQEQSSAALISTLDSAFPKQKTAFTKQHQQSLIKYAKKWC